MTTYPITTSALVDVQEQPIGRPLTGKEQELTGIAAEIINLDYQDGQTGVPMTDMETWLKAHGATWESPACRRFWHGLQRWRINAYLAGRKAGDNP